MSDKQNVLTIEHLKTYLYSLEELKEKDVKEKIAEYEKNCEAEEKEVKESKKTKIKENVNKSYKTKLKTRDEILALLDEISKIPTTLEKVEIMKYMLERANDKKALNIANKVNGRICRRYNQIVENIEKKTDVFSEFDEAEEINFSVFKTNGANLKKAREEFKKEYTQEEKNDFISQELEILEKSKQFSMTPIPHEILKNSDREIQSKMQKFNKVRQKRLRIMSTMEEDYTKLIEPRATMNMIDEAIANVEDTKEILTKSEYKNIKNSLIKNRKKVYKSTNETRNIIKTKEKKTGIIVYNIQEARYARMESLRNVINEATSVIKSNTIRGGEEQLEKLKISYEREKQYASVIEKLEEEPNNISNNEVQMLKEQITSLDEKLKKSKKIITEQDEIVEKAKKELVILWKLEIDSTISRRKETLELPEVTETKKSKSAFLKLKKMPKEKHACV